MGIKDWFKGITNVPDRRGDMPAPTFAAPKPKAPRKPRVKKEKTTATVLNLAKDAATLKGEPWVDVVRVELDPINPGAGAFELDWNDIFVARLVKAGYVGRTDQAIVDMWFQDVCRNVVLATYEQDQADPDKRMATPVARRKNLGDGRSEIS